MKSARRKLRRLSVRIVDYVAVSLATMLAVYLFVQIPFSFSRFNTAQSLREQYELTDAYFTIFHGGAPGSRSHAADDKIVIVDVHGITDRDSLRSLIEQIAHGGAKAIGIDLIFRNPRDPDADARLIAQLLSDERITTACKLTAEQRDGNFSGILTSFFGELPLRCGFTNLATEGVLNTCRSFVPELRLNGRPVPGFTSALMQSVSEEQYRTFRMKAGERPLINFNTGPFAVIDPQALSWNLPLIKERIVLLGDASGDEDVHPTPVDQRMHGVVIHAHTLATMLHGRYIRTMSDTQAWCAAFLGTLLLLPLIRRMNRNEWLQIAIPIVQVLLIMALIFLGYLLFIHYNYYVRYIYLLLCIGFSETVCNLYFKIRKTLKKQSRP